MIPTQYQNLPGLRTVYSETELRIAIAIAEVMIANALGGGGSGGDASAANQLSQIALETAIRDRLPSALSSNRLLVDGSQVTQPISASSLPLATGASTSALQTTGNNSLASIDGKTPSNPSLEHTTAVSPSSVRLSDGTTFYKGTTPSDTQPISAATLPLPSGASTETTLAAINTKIPSSPSQDRTTAASPSAVRLTDGTSFYKATTPTDTQIIGGNVANAATDSGNPIKIGAVYRTTPPLYTDGQRADLRVNEIGELLLASIDVRSAIQNITTADVGSSSTAGANGQTILSGTPTAGSFAVVSGSGNSSFAIQIDGTFVGTLQFERSLDGGLTYTSIGAFAAGTRFTTQTVTSLPGRFHGNSSSSTQIRVRATSWTSGTANVSILLGQGAGTITIGNPVTTLPLFTQFAAEPQLTAPGSTQSLDVTAFHRVHCQYVIANINTNVVVRLEGSNDGTNWSNLAQGEVDTTRTTNGAFSLITSAPLFRVRFTFVSESGGTNATIDVRFTAN